jgi:hypothetical protein
MATGNAPQLPQPGASLSDILTSIKNLVIALNGATQAFKDVNGVSTLEGVTVPTVVKSSPGRVVAVSIITAGSSTGMIYDSGSLTQNAPLWVIPMAAKSDGEPYMVDLPTDSGILLVPGNGQSVTLNWS